MAQANPNGGPRPANSSPPGSPAMRRYLKERPADQPWNGIAEVSPTQGGTAQKSGVPGSASGVGYKGASRNSPPNGGNGAKGEGANAKTGR